MLLYLFIELSLRFFTMQPKIIRCKTCDLIVIFIVDPSQLWINEIPSPFRNLHLWNLHLPLITRQNQEGRGWILIDMRLNISFSKYYKEHHFMCILFLDISHCQDEFFCMKLSILKIFFWRFQDYHDVLHRCIKDDMGFKKGKPVAACIIYKCLLYWGVFEAERTTIFDFIIHTINTTLKVRILFFFLNHVTELRSLLVSTFCFSGRKREWHFALLASQYICSSMHVAKKLKVKRIHHGSLSIVFGYSLKWKGKWSECQPIQHIHLSACTLHVPSVHWM